MLLVADESFARHSGGTEGRRLFRHNRIWAEQVAARRPEVSIRVLSVTSDDEVWSTTLAGYRAAARAAGPSGTVGVLVGHGFGGTRVGADLAPPPHCRIYEDQLVGLSRNNIPGTLAREQERVIAIASALAGPQPQVDLYTCNLGSRTGIGFLNHLAEVWRVRVRALMGKLGSMKPRGEPVDMYLTDRAPGVPRGRWRDRLPEDIFWRSSQMLERPIEMPSFKASAPAHPALGEQ